MHSSVIGLIYSVARITDDINNYNDGRRYPRPRDPENLDKKQFTNLLRMATKSPPGATSVTSGAFPIACLSSSVMARTIGNDMLTRDPSSRRSELKWRLCKYSCSRMNPLSGLAHPSDTTWTHSRSTAPILT